MKEIALKHYIIPEKIGDGAIVDVGACMGIVTQALIEMFPDRLVYAVEPSHRCQKILREREWSIHPPSMINAALVASGNKEVAFVEQQGGKWTKERGHIKGTRAGLENTITYKSAVVSIERLLHLCGKIAYLKMSIPQGGLDILRTVRGVGQLSVEMNPKYHKEAIEILSNQGYCVVVVNKDVVAYV